MAEEKTKKIEGEELNKVQKSKEVKEELNEGDSVDKVEKVEENHEKQLEDMTKKADEAEKKSEEIVEEKKEETRDERQRRERLEEWIPKTQLGKDVLAGKVKDIDVVLNKGRKILEPEIVDILANVQSDLLFIGQAKGKFGGGKRRAWRQTQKKTKEGNIPTFSVMAVVGDGKGHVGIGVGRAKETLPAREKAIRKAKLNLIKIPRACASYDCLCEEEHSIPVTTRGKCSSVGVELIPAPQGTGLVAGEELRKILKLAGIKDVYSKTSGKTRTTFNLAKACIDALGKLRGVKR